MTSSTIACCSAAFVLLRAHHHCEGSPFYPLCRAENHRPHPVTGSFVILTVAIAPALATAEFADMARRFPESPWTPKGLLAIRDIPCVPRVDALTWGAEDLSAAIGARRNRTDDGRYLPVFEHARTACLISASAAGVQPLDTVFTDVTDPDGLRRDCLDGAWVGFTGKISIHPSQIDVINEVFTPSAEDVARARGRPRKGSVLLT